MMIISTCGMNIINYDNIQHIFVREEDNSVVADTQFNYVILRKCSDLEMAKNVLAKIKECYELSYRVVDLSKI